MRECGVIVDEHGAARRLLEVEREERLRVRCVLLFMRERGRPIRYDV